MSTIKSLSFRFICLVFIAAISFPSAVARAEDVAENVEKARSAVQQLAKRLKSELVAAIEADGATAAIGVCNIAAPAITEEIAEAHGGKVGRTALKLRNPANAPDAWERAVLEAFTAQLQAGADPKTLEHQEVLEVGGKRVFRYMKAIPTGKPCLTCHGPAVEPALYERIKALYPQDAAIGFAPGSLRGAFTVTLPVE